MTMQPISAFSALQVSLTRLIQKRKQEKDEEKMMMKKKKKKERKRKRKGKGKSSIEMRIQEDDRGMMEVSSFIYQFEISWRSEDRIRVATLQQENADDLLSHNSSFRNLTDRWVARQEHPRPESVGHSGLVSTAVEVSVSERESY